MLLMLTAFNTMVKAYGGDRPGWFKATAIGMGYFAHLPGAGDLSPILRPLLLHAWHIVLTKHSFSHVAVVEFPDFGGCVAGGGCRGGHSLVSSPGVTCADSHRHGVTSLSTACTS